MFLNVELQECNVFHLGECANIKEVGLRLLERGEEGKKVWAAHVPITGRGHPQGPHSGFCFCSTLLKLMIGSNVHQPDASQSHSQSYLNRRKPHPLQSLGLPLYSRSNLKSTCKILVDRVWIGRLVAEKTTQEVAQNTGNTL